MSRVIMHVTCHYEYLAWTLRNKMLLTSSCEDLRRKCEAEISFTEQAKMYTVQYQKLQVSLTCSITCTPREASATKMLRIFFSSWEKYTSPRLPISQQAAGHRVSLSPLISTADPLTGFALTTSRIVITKPHKIENLIKIRPVKLYHCAVTRLF